MVHVMSINLLAEICIDSKPKWMYSLLVKSTIIV